jgi:ketosteroid isomerase-like protein
MDRSEVEDVARRAYAAYAESARDSLEPLIAEGFTFCSPDDPELERVTGDRFRNTEYLRVRDGQLVRAEVYYGASA